MIHLSSTELGAVKINIKAGESSGRTRAVGNKIGWIRSFADVEGASFDLKVNDAMGRTKFERKNCKSDTKEYGELINAETLLGEDLEVVIDNVKGANEIQVFLN